MISSIPGRSGIGIPINIGFFVWNTKMILATDDIASMKRYVQRTVQRIDQRGSSSSCDRLFI